MGRCSEYSNYLPLPSLLIGIVNFPNGNFDNFDLRPPGLCKSADLPIGLRYEVHRLETRERVINADQV